ncbi:MAG: hypothetical protein JWP38_2403 [Herbaspirillum sp.]|nr:hypothetical protein [Herbaspirillum sp.]
MIHEFKTYRATPGNHQALVDRFQKVTLPICDRLGIKVLHCWTSADEPDAFFYLTGFESKQACKDAWAAFVADAEWKAAKAASEVNGPLLASQTTIYLDPAPF